MNIFKKKINKKQTPSMVIKNESSQIRWMSRLNPIVWAALKVLDDGAKDMDKFLNKYRKEYPEHAAFADALPKELFYGGDVIPRSKKVIINNRELTGDARELYYKLCREASERSMFSNSLLKALSGQRALLAQMLRLSQNLEDAINY